MEQILKQYGRKYQPATIARHAAAIEAGYAARIARRYAPAPIKTNNIVREIQQEIRAVLASQCGCGKPLGTCDGNSPYCN